MKLLLQGALEITSFIVLLLVLIIGINAMSVGAITLNITLGIAGIISIFSAVVGILFCLKHGEIFN